MNKSLISINNEVIFTASLWIVWSVTWILLITLAYVINPSYDIVDFFTGEMTSRHLKFFLISIIIVVIFSLSIVSLLFFFFKTLSLAKCAKLYNLNDTGLLLIYFLVTFLLYFGIAFFIMYKDKIRNVRTAKNNYENRRMNYYLGSKDLRGVSLDDNRIKYIENNVSPNKNRINSNGQQIRRVSQGQSYQQKKPQQRR